MAGTASSFRIDQYNLHKIKDNYAQGRQNIRESNKKREWMVIISPFHDLKARDIRFN